MSPLKNVQSVCQLLMTARALIFDFDGTLVDSNTIKLQGFDACFARFTDAWPAIRAYCYTHNHTPRWEKFRYVYEHILKQPYSNKEEQELLDFYGAETTSRVREAPEIAGASDFLKAIAGSRPMALVSSTPDALLHDFLKCRRWDSLFTEVRGAPVDKTVWIKQWCDRLGLSTREALFIGDSPEDFQAAQRAEIPFLAVVNETVGAQADGYIKDWTVFMAERV